MTLQDTLWVLADLRDEVPEPWKMSFEVSCENHLNVTFNHPRRHIFRHMKIVDGHNPKYEEFYSRIYHTVINLETTSETTNELTTYDLKGQLLLNL